MGGTSKLEVARGVVTWLVFVALVVEGMLNTTVGSVPRMKRILTGCVLFGVWLTFGVNANSTVTDITGDDPALDEFNTL